MALSCADCLEILIASTSGSSKDLSMPVYGLIYVKTYLVSKGETVNSESFTEERSVQLCGNVEYFTTWVLIFFFFIFDFCFSMHHHHIWVLLGPA